MTSTAFAVATQQANATATAIVRATEQAHYEFIDQFESYKGKWLIGATDSEYWTGYRGIKDGVYNWDVYKVKRSFISWADFDQIEVSKDFDVYVDTKVKQGEMSNVCSGLIFRISSGDFSEGGYVFRVCNNSFFRISYKNVRGDWESITDWQYSSHIHVSDWNRLEVKARGSHFDFFINGQLVLEIEDERRSEGGFALFIDVDEAPAKILFDNFGYQSR